MPVMPAPCALFELGQTVATPAALDLLAEHGVDPASLITRHVTGDWGDLDEEDRQANIEAIISGARLMSVYIVAPEAVRVYIITEAKDEIGGHRESTTILLPEEY
jgi:hypothetical protein